ncbi:MAG: hypothetical protein WDZ68_01740 [Candidatus Paceibacterota bacterium]
MNMNPRIFIASFIGILFVCGAFVLSSKQTVAAPDPRINAVTGPAPERDYIPVTDADGDGVADWKQILPKESHWLATRDTIGTTTATTTHTHTELFAKKTLEQIMNMRMNAGFGNTTSPLMDYSREYINSLATDKLFNKRDVLITQDTSNAALRAYGNSVAKITIENSVEQDIESELSILHKATETQNPDALADLRIIVNAYQSIVDDMLATPVPRTYVQEHLDLINTYNAILIDIRAMQQLFDDPLYTLVRTNRYEGDGKGLYQAISNLYLKLHEDAIRWSDGDAVSKFIKVIDR